MATGLVIAIVSVLVLFVLILAVRGVRAVKETKLRTQQEEAAEAAARAHNSHLLDKARGGDLEAARLLRNKWQPWQSVGWRGDDHFALGDESLTEKLKALWPVIEINHEYLIFKEVLNLKFAAWCDKHRNYQGYNELVALLTTLTERREGVRIRFFNSIGESSDLLLDALNDYFKEQINTLCAAICDEASMRKYHDFRKQAWDYKERFRWLGNIEVPPLPSEWNKLVAKYYAVPTWSDFTGLRPWSEMGVGTLRQMTAEAIVSGDVVLVKQVFAYINRGCGGHPGDQTYPACNDCTRLRLEVGPLVETKLLEILGEHAVREKRQVN